MSMKAEGIGGDLKKMKETMDGRLDWIWHRNMQRQNTEAIALFEESLGVGA